MALRFLFAIGTAIVAGMIGRSVGSSKRRFWYGSVLAKTEGNGDMYMLVLDPNQSGSFEREFNGDIRTYSYAPLAVARVNWDGKSKVTINKTGNVLASGKIVTIFNYEMSPNPSGKPVAGDAILFD